MTIRRNVILFLSSGCGLGYIPKAPGTFGTLAGLPICWLMTQMTPFASLISAAAIILASIWISDQSARILGRKDPGIIVIDEICGMMVALMGLAFSFLNVGLGFILFRILDISKPVPIRTLERRIAGGTGIVIDDIAAGLMVNIILRIVAYLTEI